MVKTPSGFKLGARRQGSYKVPTGGILAAASRNASPASKKANPRLRKVK